jgi:hypothetical protein
LIKRMMKREGEREKERKMKREGDKRRGKKLKRVGKTKISRGGEM